MVENNYPEGIVIAHLLVERQIDDAYRWRYEWVILTNVGVVALILADAAWNAGVDVLTLLGIATLAVFGLRLTLFERHRFDFLLHLYYKLDGPLRFSPRRLRF